MECKVIEQKRQMEELNRQYEDLLQECEDLVMRWVSVSPSNVNDQA